jgi:hypothetical protein
MSTKAEANSKEPRINADKRRSAGNSQQPAFDLRLSAFICGNCWVCNPRGTRSLISATRLDVMDAEKEDYGTS